MSFWAYLGIGLAVVLVIALVVDFRDRKRGGVRGVRMPGGHRPSAGEAQWIGNDLNTYKESSPDDPDPDRHG